MSNNDRFEPFNLEEIDEEEILEPEEKPAELLFDNGKGYVTSEEADRISQQGFYGTRLDDGGLELEPVEILHLLERKRVIARTPAKLPLTSKEIVNQLLPSNPDLWIMYLVFRDLRSRGYVVRQGFGKGIGFRVYARGERPGLSFANQLIYVLKEGEPISLNDLDMVTQTATASRKDLVFALVDQNGEVNYYRVARAVLPKRGGELDG